MPDAGFSASLAGWPATKRRALASVRATDHSRRRRSAAMHGRTAVVEPKASGRDRAEERTARSSQRSTNPCGPRNFRELRARRRRESMRPASSAAFSPTPVTTSLAMGRDVSRQALAPFAFEAQRHRLAPGDV
jgi:hypothetical protein